MKNKLSRFAVPYEIWMALFVVAPIVIMVIYAFTSQNGGFSFENFVKMGDYTAVFLRSFKMALIATAICLLIGYPVSYLMSREGKRFQRIAMVLIMLPMWMNFLLRTYAWMTLLGNNGIINHLLGLAGLGPYKLINTSGAVVLGMVYNYLPFMILPLYNAISKIDDSVLEAASDLGANDRKVLSRIILPLSFPGIVSGITMVFVPSLTTFVVSDILGRRKVLLIGNIIEQEFSTASNRWLGSGLSLVLMIFILISMAVLNHYDKTGEGAVL